MVNIIKQEIEIETALKNKIEFICSYENNLYNDSDISYITKDTPKEKEMNLYLEEKDYEF